MADQRTELQNNDDAADAAHETGDHRIRNQCNVTPDTTKPQQDLQSSAQDYGGKRYGRFLAELGDDPGPTVKGPVGPDT